MAAINNEKPDYMKAAAIVGQIARLMHEVEGIVHYEELSEIIGWTWTHETEKMEKLEKDLQIAADRAALIEIMNRRTEGPYKINVTTSATGPLVWHEVTEVYPATMEIEIGGGGLSPEVIPFSDVQSLLIDI